MTTSRIPLTEDRATVGAIVYRGGGSVAYRITHAERVESGLMIALSKASAKAPVNPSAFILGTGTPLTVDEG